MELTLKTCKISTVLQRVSKQSNKRTIKEPEEDNLNEQAAYMVTNGPLSTSDFEGRIERLSSAIKYLYGIAISLVILMPTIAIIIYSLTFYGNKDKYPDDNYQ